MKYCTKCGKELFDEAVICPGCGCPTAQMQHTQAHVSEPDLSSPPEKKPIPTSAKVFGIISIVFGSLSIVFAVISILFAICFSMFVPALIGGFFGIIGTILGNIATKKNPNNVATFRTTVDKSGKTVVIPNKLKYDVTNIGGLLSSSSTLVCIFIFVLTLMFYFLSKI